MSSRHADRYSLLQKQLRRLHRRVGMKTSLDQVVLKNVSERNQAHSLVVSHKRSNQDRLLTFGQSFRRVVDSFIKAVWSKGALFLEPSQIGHRRSRIDAGRQHRCIRRNDEIFNQAALESESRNAKWSILIVEMKIAHVVSGFGNAPRHPALLAILHLALNHRTIGFGQQRGG